MQFKQLCISLYVVITVIMTPNIVKFCYMSNTHEKRSKPFSFDSGV